MFSTCTNTRQLAIEIFNQTLRRAYIVNLIAKLTSKKSRLKCFEEIKSDNSHQKRYLGVRQISTKNITGSVGRIDDFDSQFRPLKNHLRDRWVNVAIQLKISEWPPIEAIKIGEDYFVVDGHHRASVARSTGIAFMDAEVWEITKEPKTIEDRDFSWTSVAITKSTAIEKALSCQPEACCTVTAV